MRDGHLMLTAPVRVRLLRRPHSPTQALAGLVAYRAPRSWGPAVAGSTIGADVADVQCRIATIGGLSVGRET